MIPGRVRPGWLPPLANVVAFAVLALGTQILARQTSPWNPAAWSTPWTGDLFLVTAGLLLLGLGFMMPLHAGVMNLAIYAEFLAGFSVAVEIAQTPGIDPITRALLALVAGAAAGALTGAVVLWLKWRFAVHEILSGLLLGGALIPLAASVAPLGGDVAPGLSQQTLLTGGILLLALAVLISFAFAHYLRSSAHGFHLRIVGSNPLAAVAAGVDVDLVQLWMLTAGGACAGLTGALVLLAQPSPALERWPLPLAFAGITVAVYGLGSVRGVLAASVLFALWIVAPGTPVPLEDPAWGTAVVTLLLLPALWTLPRILPDQGSPRALWRTRHREPY